MSVLNKMLELTPLLLALAMNDRHILQMHESVYGAR